MSMETVEGEDDAPVEVDHSPTVVSSVGAVVAGVVAALASAPFAVIALPLGVGGVGILAGGLFFRSSRTMVSIGTGGLFLAVLVAGGFGIPVELLLLGATASVVAWDLGRNAISLGEQVGRHSTTTRNEAIHASITVVVALVAAALGYGVALLAGGGKPMAALAVVLFGVLALFWAIRT